MMLKLTEKQESKMYAHAVLERRCLAKRAWRARKSSDTWYAGFLRRQYFEWKSIESTMRLQSGRKPSKYQPEQ